MNQSLNQKVNFLTTEITDTILFMNELCTRITHEPREVSEAPSRQAQPKLRDSFTVKNRRSETSDIFILLISNQTQTKSPDLNSNPVIFCLGTFGRNPSHRTGN